MFVFFGDSVQSIIDRTPKSIQKKNFRLGAAKVNEFAESAKDFLIPSPHPLSWVNGPNSVD